MGAAAPVVLLAVRSGHPGRGGPTILTVGNAVPGVPAAEGGNPGKKAPSLRTVLWFWKNYLAYSTALVSRMTLTLIWPGYSSSCSIFLAMSRARRIMLSSVTTSGLTMMRISRPAWMA